MGSMIRAKFRCNKVDEIKGVPYHPAATNPPPEEKMREEIEFYPVTSGSGENAEWAKYTPGGFLRMTIDNPAAWSKFVVGGEYYLDFTPATAEVKAAV